MKKYLGHEFKSMSDLVDDCHVQCKNCNLKSYFDSGDKKYYHFDGMSLVKTPCTSDENDT